MQREDDQLMKTIVKTFRQYDQDGDGMISRDELAHVFSRIDPAFWTSEKIDGLMRSADINGDNRIDYTEFVAWLAGDLTGNGNSDGWEDARVMVTYSFNALFNSANFLVFEAGDITDAYLFGRWTSFGRAASICEAVDKTSNLTRRLRRVRKADCDPDVLEEEVRALQVVDHPNIEKLFQVFEDDQQVYLVFGSLEGGRSLKECLLTDGIATEQQCSFVARQLARGLHHMHANHVAHREIGPKNVIILDSGSREVTARIVNCVHAVRFEQGDMWTDRFGELFYMSPQMATGGYYSCITDIWSLGILTYHILCGYPPFAGEDDPETRSLIKTCALCFPADEWGKINASAKTLCTELLVVEEEGRLSLRVACNHAWFGVHERPTVYLEPDVLERMKQWSREEAPSTDTRRNSSNVRRLSLHVLAQHVNHDNVKELREMFEQLDENGDGTLTFSEFRSGLDKSFIEFHPASLKMLLEGLDAEGTARINYTEFLAASMDAQLMDDDAACRAAFQFLDRDRSGFVSVQELQEALEACCSHVEEDLVATMQEFDTNGDGHMDFSEFRALLLGHDVEAIKRRDAGRRRVRISGQPDARRSHSDSNLSLPPPTPPPASRNPRKVPLEPEPRSRSRPRRAGAGAR